MKGNAGFNILPTASAIVYAGDDVKIGGSADFGGTGEDEMTGKGITNPSGNPASLQIYGVDPKAKISIKGNGSLTAVVYSPDAEVKIHGNSDVFGSFVGEKISVKGRAMFHYDEALSNYGPNDSFGLNRWRELSSSTDRAAYTTQLSF